MKVLIDTCVVVDLLQKREPFAEAAYRLFQAAAEDRFDGCITAKSATDIYYIMRRHMHDSAAAREKLNSLLTLIGMLDTAADDVFHAISSPAADFEDAVLMETAARCRMDRIVTRNIRDFRESSVPVCTPEEFLEQMKREREC